MSGALRSLRQGWDHFWFAPETACNLAAARVLICAHSLWIVLSRDYAGISGVGQVWTFTPIEARWRFFIAPGHPALEGALQWGAVVALLVGFVGIRPRVSCLIAGLLLYHLAPF